MSRVKLSVPLMFFADRTLCTTYMNKQTNNIDRRFTESED